MRQLSIGITLLLALVAVAAYGQTDGGKAKKKKDNMIGLSGTVADGFTKAPIPDVKVILMREDSTAVDTTKVWEYHSYSSGIGRSAGKTDYNFLMSREPARYILKFEHPNYETAYADFTMKQVSRRQQTVEGPKVYLKKAARADHFEGGDLKEVVVKATKVKMVWRGDTLIYNADAFNVPEGSMLDGLIKQLPGVELKDNGEIFVNGKKIDNLTLNGADFFKGKNKIMLQNLPYFTVKNVKVYKKQTEENRYLGIDDEDKKEYTMDVVLKREYSTGASANVEAGYGPSEAGDGRYKLKGFGLRFSDHTRAVVFGGLNNINQSMQFDAEGGDTSDRTSQSGNRHFKQAGAQFVYQAPEEKLSNATEVDAEWSDERSENRQQSESYMSGASTFGRSEGSNRYKTDRFSLKNTLRATGLFYLYSRAELTYNSNRNESESWNLSSADAVMTDSINSSWYRSRNKTAYLSGNVNADVSYRMPTGDSFRLSLQGSGLRNFNPESTSLSHYHYYKLGTHEERDRRTESPTRQYNLQADLTYNYQVTKTLRLEPAVAFGKNSLRSSRHEYLRDSIDYLFDSLNSYEQHTETTDRRASLGINYGGRIWKWFLSLNASFGANFQRQQMSYDSEPLATALTRNYTILSPSAFLYLNSPDNRRNMIMQYYMWETTPSVTSLISRPITSDPLNIFLGNPDLKKSNQHQFFSEYRMRKDSIDQTIALRLEATMTHNAQTQGYSYNMTTGVRTYRPENIAGGNWNARVSVNWNRALDSLKVWHIGNELSLRYTKSTSFAASQAVAASQQEGEQPAFSRVGTTQLGYSPTVRFQKPNVNINLRGDITYRHYHRNITLGVQPTDVWDIAYGLNGSYHLPWNFTFETDLMMHSRRGYTDHEMNDNRLYWDASLTKSFHQGQWVVKLRGYDLLGQVSNLQYYISAQGRTETWTNALRRYALLSVSYRFSQKPKKEK